MGTALTHSCMHDDHSCHTSHHAHIFLPSQEVTTSKGAHRADAEEESVVLAGFCLWELSWLIALAMCTHDARHRAQKAWLRFNSSVLSLATKRAACDCALSR